LQEWGHELRRTDGSWEERRRGGRRMRRRAWGRQRSRWMIQRKQEERRKQRRFKGRLGQDIICEECRRGEE